MDLTDFSLGLSALAEDNKPDLDATYDLLILGGSAAAMTAALYAARKLMKTAILTRNLGGQMMDTWQIENYLGFQAISGKELTKKFEEHVRHFEVPIGLGENVSEVRKEGEVFKVALESGETYAGKSVIVATGKRSRPLNVPGENELKGKGVAYCAICDAPFYKDKKVVVAGGGNSAFTAALDLLKVAKEVTLVNFSQGWQADGIIIESVKKYERANFLDYHQVTRIEGTDNVTAVVVKNRETGEEKKIEADGIFVEIGLLPNTDPVKNLAKLNEANELVVDCHSRTNVEGLFGAGDVTTVPYKQIVISAGEGAKAALSAYDYLTKKGLL